MIRINPSRRIRTTVSNFSKRIGRLDTFWLGLRADVLSEPNLQTAVVKGVVTQPNLQTATVKGVTSQPNLQTAVVKGVASQPELQTSVVKGVLSQNPVSS